MSFSMTILEGNIGNDPEVKKVGRDGMVANFSLATEYSYKDSDGKKVKETSWHNIVAWGKLAEIIEDYLEKGSRVLITGRIKYETYEKDGEKKYITKIIAEKVDIIKGKDRDDDRSSRSRDDDRGRGKKKDDDEDRGSRKKKDDEDDDRGSRRGKQREDDNRNDYEDDIPF